MCDVVLVFTVMILIRGMNFYANCVPQAQRVKGMSLKTGEEVLHNSDQSDVSVCIPGLSSSVW